MTWYWGWLLFFAAYLIAGLVAARVWLWLDYREHGSLDDEDYRTARIVVAFWPLAAAGGAWYLLLNHVIEPLMTPAAVRRDERAERERKAAATARREAEKLDLPWPGVDR